MNLNDRIKKVMSFILSVDLSVINDGFSKDVTNRWDSLRHMNLILALEEEFGIVIPDEEAAHLTSYKLIQLVVSELISKNKP